jgi:hypothetical protein
MKRTATTLLGIAILLFAATSALAANGYPPGPAYRTCPDTLKIYDVEQPDTLIAPCHPVVSDTVKGIKGIVIGFDAKPSAFAVYMQNSQGGPFTGVQCFTGATNYSASPYFLALGDSISVTGTVQEFPASNGTTEIEGPDVVQSTNDIIINKLSTGNPLPPFQIVTTTQLNWIPTSIGNQGEMWEACLVRLRPPLKVGRTSLQGGLPTLPFNSFLVVSSVSPGDSTLIDGNTLTTFTPPVAGTNIDSIQGIVNQNTTSGTNSYRVQLRDGNDIFLAAPPNLVDAYPIEDNILRLQFDRDVDVTTAQNAGNYSLASGIDGSTVDVATVEGGSGRFVQLQITSVRVDGDIEVVSAVGIGSASCPTCLMSQQQRTFVNGVLDCATVQAPDPAQLSYFDDRSRFAGAGTTPGTRLTVRAVSVGQYGSLYYLNDSPGQFRGGVSVFGPSGPLTRGHQFVIAGQVQEFGNETEIVNNVYLLDEGTASGATLPALPEPNPAVETIPVLRDTTTDMTQSVLTGEDYECRLVKLFKNVMVTEWRTTGQSFFVAGVKPDFADTILVSNLNGVMNAFTPPDSGSFLQITGVMHFTNGTFRICPRGPADIVNLGTTGVGGSGTPHALEFSIQPNPSRVAQVNFSLPRRGDVEIGVYDIAGRQVATIAKGAFGPGVYSRRWNGMDGTGRSVASGVYLVRLKFGSEQRVLRAVMLK